MSTAAAYEEKTFTTQDGLSLYYRDYNSRSDLAPPVLCVAGLTRNSRDFDAIAAHIAASGRRVVTLDNRGRGNSDYDPTYMNYHPQTYVGDVIALLAAAQLHKVVMLGTSLGGIMAMILGILQPNALSGVILNDIGPEIDPAGLGRIAGYVGLPTNFPTLEAATAAFKASQQSQYRNMTDDDWDRLAAATFTERDGEWVPDYDMNVGRAMKESKEPIPDLWPAFKALSHVPVLCLHGEMSDILAAKTVEAMAEAHPDFRSLTVKDRGHVPILDEAEVQAAIDDFLAHVAGKK